MAKKTKLQIAKESLAALEEYWKEKMERVLADQRKIVKDLEEQEQKKHEKKAIPKWL